ncbi:hypothetical protein F5878DRAFT_628000 [Lentinula raphanica]|uniref:BBC1/AIM3 cysteine proteinase-fold domain-containing protein n=1 Tax=Lentinula raphanica TaxID=153919 RepID=A0AA38P336_9AGAR|nr:hypothetical protein F5878DRAFT_628000 [Lentinula raphanica]
MSDQAPPPKPKPGSLRDRIAAFEKPNQSNAPPPVAARPKPSGHVAWKPRQATPPDSPAPDETSSDMPKKFGGGMSASDAKESIGKGGSLKERMAALQGKGAFGAPAPPPPVAPKPAIDKPKWKPPPPPVAPPDVERETDNVEGAAPLSIPSTSPADELNKAPDESSSTRVDAQPETQAEEGEKEGEQEGEQEVDPEEEERQRRAALAARMARLGGARVGMGPPVFGGPAYKKPQPKPEPKSDQSSKEDISEPAKSEEPRSKEPSLKSPPALEKEDIADEATKQDYFDAKRKTSDASSLLSPDPAASVSTSPRTPSSMPVPAAPRRAAPPRRKAAKSPAPPPPPTEEQEPAVIAPSTEQEPEVPVPSSVDDEKVGVPDKVIDQTISTKPLVDDVPPESEITEEPATIVPVEETPIPTNKTEYQVPETIEAIPSVSASVTEEGEAPVPVETEEEDEASRRKRVAERLAKSGGVNPFALPPQRRPSSSAVSLDEEPVPSASAPLSPASQKRTSIRKSSSDSVSSPISAPARRGSQMSVSSIGPPTKKPSMDSVMSHDIIPHDDDVNLPVPARITEEPESAQLMEEADITDEELVDEEFPPSAEDNARDSPGVLPITEITPILPPFPPETAHSAHESKPSFDSLSEPDDQSDDAAPPPPPPPSAVRSMPPPPRLAAEQEEEHSPAAERIVHTEPPRRLPPRPVLDDDGEMSDAPLPHPSRLSVPPAPPRIEDDGEEESSEDEPKPILPSRPNTFVPLSADRTAEESVEERALESPEEILPTPPRRPSHEKPPAQEEPLFVPPPPPPKSSPIVPRRTSVQVEKIDIPRPSVEQRPHVSTPTSSVSNVDQRRAEILDEEEGDPIDPSFHSPPSRHNSVVPISPETAERDPEPEPEPEQAPVEDEEQARRRTIAERMAKLGGLKFGAAPIPMGRPAPPKRRESEEESQRHQLEAGVEEIAEPKPELTEEEEERARKERIAAKMASMGGMRIGMQPYGMFAGKPPPTHPKPPAVSSESENVHVPPPPRHAAPPPPPPPQDVDSEHESLATSDEGVKVEAEESEMEEVNYEDAEEDQDEDEVPPPVPTRDGRHSIPHPMPTPGRPPVPTTLPIRKASIQSATSQKSDDTVPIPPPRKLSIPQTLPPSTSDYVMVEGEEEVPPPPPPRVGRPVPPRAAPLPPQGSTSAVPASESISSQWELPSIPSVDFGGSADLSLSWTDDMASSTSSVPPIPPSAESQSTRPPAPPAHDLVLSPEDLVAIWGRVGVQVCEVATTLFEKSKKALIGDGTYSGFIDATLKEVPNAAPISGQDYGYLIYMQSGASVQKRASDILPGDVVWMHDAKFKGHKGIQTYSQTVGSTEPLLGVVGEFESKKFKIRVFQANQHVGQQTVESVSYRLEDLKSGLVKIFRVLEA